MTAIRLRCFPVRPICPDARNVWVPEEGGTGFYLQDDENPYLSTLHALYSLLPSVQTTLFKKGRVSGEPDARIYSTPDGYLAIVPETYEVAE